MTGKRFFRLLVVGRYWETYKPDAWWVCKCDCGKTKAVKGVLLRNGTTSSCGCFHTEIIRTHNKSKTGAYKVWGAMKERCLNPKNKGYRIYGGRGITVCKRWMHFENFYADMGERPRGLTLERINNNGNYSPNNCKWATIKEQLRNTRLTTFITFKGVRKSLGDWADELGINKKTIGWRLRHGKTPAQALSINPLK